jgi:hypothetical protein
MLSTLRLLSPPGLLAAALAGAPAALAITGVCPDGSIFVVQSASDIPCKQAKRIEPQEVPPVRPENLPRPYLWEVHREKLDQNNPYNLVDRAAQMRKLGRSDVDGAAGAPPHAADMGAAAANPPSVASGPPHATAARSGGPRSLGLSDGEVRDLFFLVELSQQQAPATFTLPTVRGAEALRVSFAWSQAFADRVHAAASTDGKPLLFSVQAKEPTSFQPNFTFVQGAVAFTPKRDDASQFAVLQGHTGALAAQELALGYVVLPAAIDLARPIDVYWDDRRLAATFRP